MALQTDILAEGPEAAIDGVNRSRPFRTFVPAPTPPSAPRAHYGALTGAVADRRGYVDWHADHAGWLVEMLRPKRESARGGTPEEVLARRLVRLMVDELGVGPPA